MTLTSMAAISCDKILETNKCILSASFLLGQSWLYWSIIMRLGALKNVIKLN